MLGPNVDGYPPPIDLDAIAHKERKDCHLEPQRNKVDSIGSWHYPLAVPKKGKPAKPD
jgi:hypothetical protein